MKTVRRLLLAALMVLPFRAADATTGSTATLGITTDTVGITADHDAGPGGIPAALCTTNDGGKGDLVAGADFMLSGASGDHPVAIQDNRPGNPTFYLHSVLSPSRQYDVIHNLQDGRTGFEAVPEAATWALVVLSVAVLALRRIKPPVSIKAAATAASAALFAAGCETVPMEPSPDFVPDMVVATDYAQFFKLGPQQAGGADFSLRAGETVMLQRKEFGYSRVQLENSLVGYMANEDITPAPPPEQPKPGKRKKGSRSGSRERSTAAEEDFADLPLQDINLDILPEDVPLEPLPDLLPEPPPAAPANAPAPAPEPTPIRESIPETAPDSPPVSTST